MNKEPDRNAPLNFINRAEEAAQARKDAESQQQQYTQAWFGIFATGQMPCWQIRCPCGVMVSYPINGLPTVSTKHPCAHPHHWTIRYEGIHP